MKNLQNMKRIFILVLMLSMTFSCQKETKVNEVDKNDLNKEAITKLNSTPQEIEEVTPATLELIKHGDSYFKAVVDPDPVITSLEPSVLEATLYPGESITESKLATISAIPPAGDILFMFDLTGSMGGELSNAKVESQNIMFALNSLIPNTRFGVVSHMDYPSSYNFCGYSAPYGDAYWGDYPYSMDRALTTVTADVSASINALMLGNGMDGPESYSRALYEAANDPSIGWRSDAKNIVLAWLDNVPHDCNYNFIIGGSATTGVDPGRDAIGGNADDLAILDVLNDMAAKNMVLIVLNSGGLGLQTLWNAYSGVTGGEAKLINYDGTIPGDLDFVQYIKDLIAAEYAQLDEVSLEVCTPGFESWMTSVVPTFYGPVDLPATDIPFEVTYTVPEGTEPGVYTFEVCLVGDGTYFATQTVTITVLPPIVEVPFDVHPQSCPNPLNRTSKGLLPAAIQGTADFDVSLINPETIKIGDVSPVRWAMEDVSTPFMPFIDKPLELTSCNTFGADGFMDLTLKFDLEAIAQMFSAASRNDLVVLTITGELYDGRSFVGEDIMVIKK